MRGKEIIMMTINWANEVVILTVCKAEWSNGSINIYNMDDEYLGNICGNDPAGDWQLITTGQDPIVNRWEDGAGNTCTLKGWAEF